MSHAQGRRIERLVKGVATSDGAGVKLTRVLTQDLQQRLDPFLMLDAFGSDSADDYMGGFPNHPHRGFETITYMLAGRMRHRDSAGHEGLLQNGGVQWMTAGRGIIHSEMPEQEEGLMQGFQLWLNLPGEHKMCPPWYKDIQSEDIPEVTTAEGLTARVIAGICEGVQGAMQRDHTHPLYLDLHFPTVGSATLQQTLPSTHNAFLYVYQGELQVMSSTASQTAPEKHMAILHNEGNAVVLQGSAGARAILIAGQPLREPIAQHGPFVMNTREQLMQAVDDFRSGRLA